MTLSTRMLKYPGGSLIKLSCIIGFVLCVNSICRFHQSEYGYVYGVLYVDIGRRFHRASCHSRELECVINVYKRYSTGLVKGSYMPLNLIVNAL
ncbi:hypothetical protein V8F06_005659 [Rhypophila decipiens]